MCASPVLSPWGHDRVTGSSSRRRGWSQAIRAAGKTSRGQIPRNNTPGASVFGGGQERGRASVSGGLGVRKNSACTFNRVTCGQLLTSTAETVPQPSERVFPVETARTTLVSVSRRAISESAAPGNIDKVPNGRCTTPSRPSAPEGVALGRATILPGRSRCQSWLSSLPSLRAAAVRVPVSSEPYLRRHRGMRVSRRNVAINCRASCAHGVSRAGSSVDDAGRAAGSRYGSRLVRIQ